MLADRKNKGVKIIDDAVPGDSLVKGDLDEFEK